MAQTATQWKFEMIPSLQIHSHWCLYCISWPLVMPAVPSKWDYVVKITMKSSPIFALQRSIIAYVLNRYVLTLIIILFVPRFCFIIPSDPCLQ